MGVGVEVKRDVFTSIRLFVPINHDTTVIVRGGDPCFTSLFVTRHCTTIGLQAHPGSKQYIDKWQLTAEYSVLLDSDSPFMPRQTEAGHYLTSESRLTQ
eukprot:755009-Hanusia_phi.AAC.4